MSLKKINTENTKQKSKQQSDTYDFIVMHRRKLTIEFIKKVFYKQSVYLMQFVI